MFRGRAMKRRMKNGSRLAMLSTIGVLMAAVPAAQATVVDFEWVQAACSGSACGATVSGTWTFKDEAVTRGSATYFTLRDDYPNYAPDGVETFSFTLGTFVLKGFTFGPITWTNNDAADAAGWLGHGGIYVVSFAADRQSIAAVEQRATPDWPFADPDSTTFERAYNNPSIRIEVGPDAIVYFQNTGSEPRGPDGIPVTPNFTTFTGQWRAVDVPTPIPVPGSLALVGATLLAAGIQARRARRARRLRPAASTWPRHTAPALIAATMAWGTGAHAALVNFEWVQTACSGNACGATVAGLWSFTEEAVQRGTATRFALRDSFPNYAPDAAGVEAFSFTLGTFVLKGHAFGPITWTNRDVLYGETPPVFYDVTFAADRQSISAIAERSDWPGYSWYVHPAFTVFERTPTNPSTRISVGPDKIEYYQYTGSEPRGPDGIPIIPGFTTFTGQWRAVDVPTPIPAPGPVALVGAALIAAGLGTLRTRRARR